MSAVPETLTNRRVVFFTSGSVAGLWERGQAAEAARRAGADPSEAVWTEDDADVLGVGAGARAFLCIMTCQRMLLVSRTCATLAACSSQRARAPNVCVALSLLVPELSNGPWRGKPPRASAAAHGGVRVGRVDGDDAVLDAELARDPPERLRDPTAYLSTSLASLS